MSGKLFTQSRAPAANPARARRWALLSLFVVVGLAGGSCRDRKVVAPTPPAVIVDDAIRPARFAPAFRKLGRAHFRCVARFDAGVDGTPMTGVSTETDIWIDDRGNWRLVELNDKDGGREIVLHGRELSVALRYGKMIRRPAEDPEPQQLLEEGIGAPFAAWDLLRNVVMVDDFGRENNAGRRVHVYKLGKARHPANPAATVDARDRRSWRRTVVLDKVEGTVVVDEATGVPLQANIRAQYTMRRPPTGKGGPGAAAADKDDKEGGDSGGGRSTRDDGPVAGTPMHGAVDIHASVEDLGQSPMIARPEAEDLALRQRTVPEEKALLGGLPRSAPPPKPE